MAAILYNGSDVHRRKYVPIKWIPIPIWVMKYKLIKLIRPGIGSFDAH